MAVMKFLDEITFLRNEDKELAEKLGLKFSVCMHKLFDIWLKKTSPARSSIGRILNLQAKTAWGIHITRKAMKFLQNFRPKETSR